MDKTGAIVAALRSIGPLCSHVDREVFRAPRILKIVFVEGVEVPPASGTGTAAKPKPNSVSDECTVLPATVKRRYSPGWKRKPIGHMPISTGRFHPGKEAAFDQKSKAKYGSERHLQGLPSLFSSTKSAIGMSYPYKMTKRSSADVGTAVMAVTSTLGNIGWEDYCVLLYSF